jgi:hypothetical protein
VSASAIKWESPLTMLSTSAALREFHSKKSEDTP